MPKIIPNTEEKILKAAKELFFEHRYRNIEIKTIAVKAGIAVGTLYNYFPNKQHLYLKIFEESWQETYNILEGVINLNIDPLEKLKKYVLLSYDEIEKKGGLGIELMQNNCIKNSNKHRDFLSKNKIIPMFCDCLKEVRKKYSLKFDETMDVRFAETVVLMVLNSLLMHHSDKKENIEFILNTIHCVIGETNN